MKQDETCELQSELNRLCAKFRVGKHLHVIVTEDKDNDSLVMARKSLGLPEFQDISGEVIGDILFIYITDDFKRAMHTLHHEFFEWFINARFVKGYDYLVHVYHDVITRMVYNDKEEGIERLAFAEDLEYKRLKKEGTKRG